MKKIFYLATMLFLFAGCEDNPSEPRMGVEPVYYVTVANSVEGLFGFADAVVTCQGEELHFAVQSVEELFKPFNHFALIGYSGKEYVDVGFQLKRDGHKYYLKIPKVVASGELKHAQFDSLVDAKIEIDGEEFEGTASVKGSVDEAWDIFPSYPPENAPDLKADLHIEFTCEKGVLRLDVYKLISFFRSEFDLSDYGVWDESLYENLEQL